MSERLESQLSQVVEVIDRVYPEITVAELEAMSAPELRVVEESAQTHRPLAIAAAIVIMLAIVGGIWVLLEATAGDPADQPTITEPGPTVVAPGPDREEAMEWTLVESAAGQPSLSTDWWAPMVSNGSSFLFQESAGGVRSSALWRSENGLVWEHVEQAEGHPSGYLAAGDAYLMAFEAFPDDCAENCPAWRSSDGLTWSLAETAWTAPSGTVTQNVFTDRIWRVDSVDTILQTDAPGPGSGLGPRQIVMEFEDRTVLFGSAEAAGEGFAALESTDRTTWTEIAVPPFAATDAAHRLDAFACGFDARDSLALVLLADGNGHGLWSSTDGINWTETRLDLTPLELSDSVGPISSHCIRALGDGWVIVPNYPVTPESIMVSPDGLDWRPLEVSADHSDFTGVPFVAGDTIFIVEDAPEADVLVGRIGGS